MTCWPEGLQWDTLCLGASVPLVGTLASAPQSSPVACQAWAQALSCTHAQGKGVTGRPELSPRPVSVGGQLEAPLSLTQQTPAEPGRRNRVPVDI